MLRHHSSIVLIEVLAHNELVVSERTRKDVLVEMHSTEAQFQEENVVDGLVSMGAPDPQQAMLPVSQDVG